jgi:hypothetical protein
VARSWPINKDPSAELNWSGDLPRPETIMRPFRLLCNTPLKTEPGRLMKARPRDLSGIVSPTGVFRVSSLAAGLLWRRVLWMARIDRRSSSRRP